MITIKERQDPKLLLGRHPLVWARVGPEVILSNKMTLSEDEIIVFHTFEIIIGLKTNY